MIEDIEYALMAGRAYQSSRSDINLFPIPKGWNERLHEIGSSGFEAVSFVRGSEIVISYAGTNPTSVGDWLANAGLATGLGSVQLLQAADYYLKVRQANPDPDAIITFTGHSLGGGLAALMGVFFNKQAKTFDQAPFENSVTTGIRDSLVSNLLSLRDENQQPIYTSQQLMSLAPELFASSFDPISLANSNVTTLRVVGEFTSSLFPVSAFSPIGPQTPVPHGPTDISSFDLHAQSLLTAFVQNDQFRKVTFKLTDLLGMIFDSNLYRKDTGTGNTEFENFLEHLVRHQAGNVTGVAVGGDKMLDRFTGDLQKVAQDGGLTLANNGLTKALIAFAMQMYYEKTTDETKTLFTDVDVSGGIRFDRADVADTLANARGYTYFTNYLASLPTNERDLIVQQLPNLLDWFIQAGNKAMVATAGNVRAFMLGGSSDDSLKGSTEADVLVGGAGNDVLNGFKGDDLLIGGTGYDTYIAGAGASRVVDADLRGRVLLDSTGGILSANIFIGVEGDGTRWQSADGKLSLTVTDTWNVGFDGGSVNLGSLLNDGDFGIWRRDALSMPVNPVRTFYGDKADWDSDGNPSNGVQTQPDAFGNVIRADGQGTPQRPNIAEADRADTFYGNSADEVEHFVTGGGDDIVYADGASSATSSVGGRDLIETGLGRDSVAAGGGDDWVEGGPDGDILAGNAGNDVIYGNTSNGGALTTSQAISAGETAGTVAGTGDLLSGDAGDDVVFGADTSDLLLGGEGQDVMIGGGGNDTIYGDGRLGPVTLDWSVARSRDESGGTVTFNVNTTNVSVITSGTLGGADVIYGGAGDDWVFAGAGDDYVEGGIGADALFGEAGNDVLIGGQGNDALVGGIGKDTYLFNSGDGRDEIFDDSTGADASVLVFGEGFDPNNLTIRSGSMLLDFGNGDSVDLASFDHNNPNAAAAFDSLIFADGTTLGFDEVLDRGFVIQGTEGDDNGHDTAHPVLVGTAFKDVISGLGGNDELQGRGGDDILQGGAGDDRLYGMDGNDSLFGGDGADALVGGAGDDVLDGGAGRDALWGDAGNDVLDGGAGADLLIGGAGDDAYVYGAGDSVFDYTGASRVIFGEGIAPEGLELRRQLVNGEPVYSVGLNGAVLDSEKMSISVSDDTQLAAFEFADGTVLDHEALLHETWVDQQMITGTAGADVLDGYAGNDFVHGGDGNDTITGRRGNDNLQGEAGDDSLDGGAGNDVLSGGAGADTLKGGTGADQLEGGAGSDLYLVSRGDGDDTIFEAGGDADVLRFTDVASTEVALSHQANGDLLATVAGGGSVTVSGYYNAAASKIERIEFSDAAFVESASLDTLTVAPIAGTAGDDVLVGTAYADTLQGGAGNDTLDGGGGNDVLEGGSGADTYRLRPNGSTDVIVEDGAALSLIQLDAGWAFADTTTARQGDDLVLSLKNGNSSQVLPGYYQGQTNWAVRTDAGEQKTVAQLVDYLASIKSPTTAAEFQSAFLDNARTAYATYLASWGAVGGIVVNEQAPSNASTIYVEVPAGETGPSPQPTPPVSYLNFAHITAGNSANSLDFRQSRNTIAFAGAGDDFINNSGFAFGYTDQSTGTWTTIGSFLDGGAGNDTVAGSWAADTIIGGAGDDYLAGELGNDTYVVFAADQGVKVIDEVNEYLNVVGYVLEPNENADTLIFADIPYTAVSFSVSQFDTTSTSTSGHGQIFTSLDISSTNGTVRLLLPDINNPYIYQFPGESYGVETVRFSDGVTLTQTEILNYLSPPTTGTPGSDATVNGTAGDDFLFNFNGGFQRTTFNGFGGNDTIYGGSQNDVLNGGDGNDYLSGADGSDVLVGGAGDDNFDAGSGDDVLDGGPGTDSLFGGRGNDTYIFNSGDGQDYILNNAGPLKETDVLQFGPGISPSDIGVTRNDPPSYAPYSSHLYLAVLGTADRVTLQYEGPGGLDGYGVQRVEFSDGTVWFRDDLLARIGPVPATPFDDVIGETDGADTVHGLAGKDSLFGFGGNDVLYGDDGDDDVEGGDGSDLLYGNQGNDQVFGGGDNDVLYGNDGDDYLEGDAGNDLMIGGDGSDDLEDWQDSNFIHAGAGDDYVYTEAAPNFVIGGTGADWIDVYAADSVVAFNRGDGEDTVNAAEAFTLTLGGGIAGSDLTLEADGNDLVLRAGANDSIRLTGSGPSDWPALRLQVIGEDVRVYDLRAVIQYYNGQAQTQPGLVLSLGSVLPTYLTQSSVGQAYGGDLAYDYARGRLDENVSAATVLPVITDAAFGIATQTVTNPDGPPISGSDNGSVVLGSNASEQISGGAGNDWLDGGAGNDTLIGGAGNDLLTGGPGADTYVYNLGDGVDTIADPSTAGAGNTIAFGAGISADQITLGLGSLLVRVGDTGGALHLTSFDPDSPFGVRDVDTFRFADNTVLTYDALLARGFDLTGTDGADVISGTATTDRIRGELGNDVLAGGLGSDTYFFNTGDGADTIQEGSDVASVDVLRFGAGIQSGNLQVSRSGDDIVITLPSAGDRLTLSGWYATPGGTIERVEFANNTFWTAAELQSHISSNQAPQLVTPLADQTAAEDAQFSFTVPSNAFSDQDAGDTLTYSARLEDGSILPSWLSFDASSRTFSGTPANADVGSLNVRVTATDGHDASASDIFSLGVTNTNDAPTVANAVADQSAVEDQAFSFTVAANTFADVDVGDMLAYSASRADGSALSSWLSFDAQTRTFTGTPANADVGNIAVRVTATDGSAASVHDDFNLSVANTNDAPTVANPVADQNATEGAAFTFTVPANAFADVDAGDTLAYGATRADGSALPSWLSFNAATRTFSGTPANGDVGSVDLKVTATDGASASVSDTFTVTVANTNDAPTVANPIADQAATEDAAFSFTVPANTFADVDAGDTLSYAATLADDSVLPSWLAFNAATRTFSGTPGNGDVGGLNVKVTATDGSNASVSDVFAVAVTNTNDAPTVANPIADQSASEDEAFSFMVAANTFADVDAGDTLAYSATRADGSALPSWLSFNASTRTFSGTPTNNDVGAVNVRVTATDGSSASASDVFALTVANTNDAPTVANPVADQNAAEDAAFTFTVPANTFADVDVGDTLTYSASRADGSALPAWLSFSAATRTFSGTPANGDVGSLNLKVTATDGASASVSDVFTVAVANTNDAPTVANPIADQNGSEGQAFSFTVPANTFADVDVGDTLGYSATRADGSSLPAWLAFDSGTRLFTGTPPSDAGGILAIRVTATDGSNAGVFDDFVLNIADVIIVGTNGDDTLSGTPNADLIDGLAGNDTLSGGDGDDTLLGGSGNDTLIGGRGNDILVGGTGTNTYRFELGDGQDHIQESEFRLDTLFFGPGIANGDISYLRVGNDLVMSHVNGTDKVTVDSWYAHAYSFQLQTVRFESDGTILTAATLSSLGTNIDNQYTLSLGDGAKLIEDWGGNDSLAFGAGIAKAAINVARIGVDLRLAHTNGTDSVTIKDWFNDVAKQVETVTFPGTGESFSHAELTDPFLTLTGTPNADVINGGNAYGETIPGLAGDDVISGGGGNDLITGGFGNDLLQGGAGNDTYFFKAGDGQDTVSDFEGSNIVQFGPGLVGIMSQSVLSDGRLVTFSGSTDSVFVQDPEIGFSPVAFVFEINGTNAAETINGSVYGDIIQGLGGNDVIHGGDGIDQIYGGAGNDTLEGGTGADFLYGGEGDDILDAELLTDTFGGGGGSTGIYVGGPGNDTLNGNSGWDQYYFYLGDGQDIIHDESYGGQNSLQDQVIFGPGITAESIWGTSSGVDLIVSYSATDRFTIQYQLSTEQSMIDEFDFNDGSTLDRAGIAALQYVQQGTSGNDTLTGGASPDALYGKAGNDTLSGLDGNDKLVGGTGNDVLNGGLGDDRYIIGSGDGQDRINDVGGTDIVEFGPGLTASNMTLGRSGNDLVISVNGTSDRLTITNYLTDSASRIETFTFADGSQLPSQAAILDQLINVRGTPAGDALTGSSGYDVMFGYEGNDTLTALGDNDQLFGGAGDDTLIGGQGNDTLFGEDGNDLYQYALGDGQDVISDVSGVDAVAFGTGIATTAVTTARSGSDLLLNVNVTGNNGSVTVQNYFNGQEIEEIRFSDSTIWDVATVRAKVLAASSTTGNDVILGYEGDDTINALAGNDTVDAKGGNDFIDGGPGIDTMYGGLGNDTYVVDSTSDQAIENAGEGNDTVLSPLSWTLGANLENLTLTGTSNINGTGNSLNNTLTGNSGRNTLTGGAGNDWLDGGAGTDTLVGGTGDDTYVIADSDTITENANEGIDTVRASITWTLGANLESLILTGTTNINGTGNTLANTITGNTGNNTIDGGTGADTLIGGAGNDSYVVDSVADVIVENAGEGTDGVSSSVTYTLAANVENLTLTGTSAINGTGNTLDNVLTGNSGTNTLTGGAGNDWLDGGAGTNTLIGGTGDDTYVVSLSTDVTTENASEGTDTVRSSLTWTLGANLENLTLTGTSAINGTGNALDNVLTGNSANNTLTGGAGSDWLDGGTGTNTLVGGTGNDTYVVSLSTDVTTENASEGTDTVRSSLTWTLGANLENLVLTGTAAINGTGNALANVLTGNSGINTLTGGAGNDTLDGAAGADTLVGGTGNDTYVLGRGYGADLVQENDTTSGNTDVAQFLSGIATDQIWFQHTGNDLVASVIGTSDKMTAQNWYLGSQYHIEQFKTSDGKTLLDSQVQNLVNAMAAFSPPAPGQETLPPSYATVLEPVIAANWQ